jgi:hypothetical protein
MNATSSPSSNIAFHENQKPILSQRKGLALSAQLRDLSEVDRFLIVQRHDTSKPENGLAKPPHPEQEQKRADHEMEVLADLLTVEDERRAEHCDDNRQSEHRRDRSPNGCPPSSCRSNGQNDGEGFGELHCAGRKRRGGGCA